MGLFDRRKCIGAIDIFPQDLDNLIVKSSLPIRIISIALIHYFESILMNPIIEVSKRYIYEISIRITKDIFSDTNSIKDRKVWINYAYTLHDIFEEVTTMHFPKVQYNPGFKVSIKLFKRENKRNPLDLWYFIQHKISVLRFNEENLRHRFCSFMALYNYCNSFGDEVCSDYITMSLTHMLKWYNKNGLPKWNELGIAANMATFYYFGFQRDLDEIVKQNLEKYIQGEGLALYSLRV